MTKLLDVSSTNFRVNCIMIVTMDPYQFSQSELDNDNHDHKHFSHDLLNISIGNSVEGWDIKIQQNVQFFYFFIDFKPHTDADPNLDLFHLTTYNSFNRCTCIRMAEVDKPQRSATNIFGVSIQGLYNDLR